MDWDLPCVDGHYAVERHDGGGHIVWKLGPFEIDDGGSVKYDHQDILERDDAEKPQAHERTDVSSSVTIPVD